MSDVLAAFVESRRRAAAQLGAVAIDSLVALGTCPRCNAVSALGLAPSIVSDYRSIAAFTDVAVAISADMMSRTLPAACNQCGDAVVASSVAFHAFDSGLRRDVVVLSRAEADSEPPAVALLKWELFEGMSHLEMAPLGALSREDEARFIRDAAFRNAWQALGHASDDGVARVLERLSQEYPTDPLLLELIATTLHRGHAAVARSMAEKCRAARCDDPAAHYLFGEALFVSVNLGLEPVARLPEAVEALQRALALDPNLRDAALCVCNILRFDRHDDAKAAFLDLLSKHPDYPEAHFNLALLLLASEPEAALVHFRRAESLATEDVDYPLGCARALVALGQSSGAREALDRARRLTSSHPRFDELEAAIGAIGRA